MRISLIGIFALTTVAYAEVTPTNSGVPEAISLPTRSLRGEVHGNRFRPRRPMDNMDILLNGGTSDEEHGGDRDQAPPSRKRKSPGSDAEGKGTDNVGGIASARDQATTGTRPNFRRRNGQVDLNHENAGKTPAYTPAAFSNSASQKSVLSLDSISLGSSDSWSTTLKKVLTHDQPMTVNLPVLRRQNGQVYLSNDNGERDPAFSPAAVTNSRSSSVASQMSSLSSGSIGSWSMTSRISNIRDQPRTGTSLRRQNSQFDLINHNDGKFPANSLASFGNMATMSKTSKKSSIESEQGLGSPPTNMGMTSSINKRQDAGSIGSWSMTSKMSSIVPGSAILGIEALLNTGLTTRKPFNTNLQAFNSIVANNRNAWLTKKPIAIRTKRSSSF
jgi:hypothetical protein